MSPDVTIGIPTYRSEAFIDRTLDCARRQSHAALRIVVAVDPADDATEARCRRHAAEDPRVQVLVHPARVGWVRNANAVLARMDTEFGFLYFHDDLIAPDYVEKLLSALRARPEAASAHCDLQEFGLARDLKPAHAYEGPALRRLVDFMMTRRGTTLRSLLRLARFEPPARFPEFEFDGPWSAYVFHLRLLVAGPAVAVHEALYRRWQREGGLTRSPGWRQPAAEVVESASRQGREACRQLLEAVCRTPEERRTAHHCLELFQRAVALGQSEGAWPPPAHAAPGEPSGLVPGVLDPAAEAWVRALEARLAAAARSMRAPPPGSARVALS